MDLQTIRGTDCPDWKVNEILLPRLLEQPNLGTLRIDVNQALEIGRPG